MITPDFTVLIFMLGKVFFVLATVIYAIFAFIVVKQTTTMTKNVQDKFNPVLITFCYLHLALSILLIILTLLIL